MFQTDDSWENTSGLSVLRSLFNQPGLRRHPVVEVTDNRRLFHVDVLFEGEADELGMWARFIFTDAEALLEFLAVNDIARSRITLQSTSIKGEVYAMHALTEIRARRNANGLRLFVYQCRDGREISDYPESGHADEGFGGQVVWSALQGH